MMIQRHTHTHTHTHIHTHTHREREREITGQGRATGPQREGQEIGVQHRGTTHVRGTCISHANQRRGKRNGGRCPHRAAL
jgi:hypothetical protein